MFWFGCVLLLLLVLPQDDQSSDLQTRAFECTGHYIVPMRVYDQDVLGLIDTSGTACQIDELFFQNHIAAEPATQKVEFAGPDGRRRQAPLFTVPMQIAGGESVKVAAVATSLEKVADGTGYAVKVVVGMSYLEKHPVRFNGSLSKFEQITDESLLPKSPASELRRDKQNRPLVPVRLPLFGEHDFVISTGANDEMKMESFRLEQLERSGHAVKVPIPEVVTVSADGTNVEVSRYWVRRVEICGLQVDNVLVLTGSHSLISMSLLRHFDMTIDCHSRRLWMAPLRTRIDSPLGINGTGFSAQYDSNRHLFVQKGMDAEGLAKGIGIQPGDQIIEIDGKSAKEHTYYSVKEMFSQATMNRRVRFRRGGRVFDVNMDLQFEQPFPPEWPPEREEFNPDAMPEK